jgi:hypothetical protein
VCGRLAALPAACLPLSANKRERKQNTSPLADGRVYSSSLAFYGFFFFFLFIFIIIFFFVHSPPFDFLFFFGVLLFAVVLIRFCQ